MLWFFGIDKGDAAGEGSRQQRLPAA